MWLHPEKIPSAIHRYTAEAQRVLGVLDGCLQHAKQWLVGVKMTFVDLSFVPWNALLPLVLSQTLKQVLEGFPGVKAWHERLAALPSWQRTLQQLSFAEYASQHGAPRPASEYY